MRKAAVTLLGWGLVLLFGATNAFAQTGRVTGQVTDRNTQEPLVGVQVYLEGTSFGGITQENGRYLIQNVPSGTYAVSAQLIGYATGRQENVRVRSDEAAVVDFRLGTQALRLTEVVATGTVDPTSGVKVPFTVGKVTKEDMPIPSVSAEGAIRGRVAGARVVSGSGQPGSGTSVVLRGATSISKSNEPLYVVDGVILTADLVDIDSNDIADIEVVKGAAAASLYGSRASAGVIQITTNRGRDIAEGQTRVTVRSEYGNSFMPDHSVRLTQAHHFLMDDQGNYVSREGEAVERGDRTTSENMWERIQDRNYPSSVTLYDHIDRFFDPGTTQRHSISIGQNTRSTNFMASFNQSDESGVIPGHEGFTQRSLRANLDHRLRQDLSFQISTAYSRGVRDDLSGDRLGSNPLYDLMFFMPDVDLLAANDDGEPFRIVPDPLQLQANPLYAVHFADYKQHRSRIMGNTTLRYSPANWFNLEGNLSFDRSDRNYHEYQPKGFKTINNPTGTEGIVRRSNNLSQALNGSLQAATLHSFGDLTMRMRAQGSMERQEAEFVRGSGDQLIVGDVERVDVGSVRTGSSSQTDVRSLGVLAMTALDYAGKYIVEGMVRRDGSSLFGPENRWHTYYRGSGAYIMSEEPWWPVDALSTFKLRYSIGTAGGRPGFYDQYETWSIRDGKVSKSVLGNRNLKPELQTEQEFGVDMILADRVQLTLTRATSKVEDQLLQIPLPAVFGYSVQWQNAGTVESDTWEAEVQAQVLQRGNFSWNASAVLDRTRSEITEFDRACFRTGPEAAFWLCQGETLGTMRGFRTLQSLSELPAGLPSSQFQVNDDGMVVWVGEGNTFREGVSKQLWGTSETIDGVTYDWGMPVFERDSTGQRVMVKIGDSNPDFNWGLSNNFSLGNLSLYTLFDAQVGGDIYSNTRQWAYRDHTHGDYDQRDKPQELRKPIDYYERLYNVNQTTGYFVEDASFVKLRELSLRYDIGRSLLQRAFGGAGIDRASVSLIGRNLLTWTDYTGGFDPEAGRGDATRLRFDGFGYPNFRQLTGAVEIVF